jgi:hypothetical protein
VAFEPRPTDPEGPTGIDQWLRVPLPVDGPGQVGHLVARLRTVSAVGQEHGRAVRRDHDLRVGPREPREVPNVGQPRDDQPLDRELGEAFAEVRASQPVIHGSASSATW